MLLFVLAVEKKELSTTISFFLFVCGKLRVNAIVSEEISCVITNFLLDIVLHLYHSIFVV